MGLPTIESLFVFDNLLLCGRKGSGWQALAWMAMPHHFCDVLNDIYLQLCLHVFKARLA